LLLPCRLLAMLFFILFTIAVSAGWWCQTLEAFTQRLDHHHHHHHHHQINHHDKKTLATKTNGSIGRIILPPLHATTTSRNGKKNDKASSSSSSLVEISFPTPNAAADMGIRDWPQIYHPSSWTESVNTNNEGVKLTRYILDGRGRVTIDYIDNSTGQVCRIINKQRVYPGTLVEVTGGGEATLIWDVDDTPKGGTGMIVLTPSYEEGSKLVLVGGFLLVFCVGLVIGSSSGI
jgi:hypothetical protein